MNINGHLYFVPKHRMEKVDTFESFVEELNERSRSAAVLERWVVKIAALEEKKRHYEAILRRELDGLDDEFSDLKLLSQELTIRARGLRAKQMAKAA